MACCILMYFNRPSLKYSEKNRKPQAGSSARVAGERDQFFVAELGKAFCPTSIGRISPDCGQMKG